jgi:hypothetical protein
VHHRLFDVMVVLPASFAVNDAGVLVRQEALSPRFDAHAAAEEQEQIIARAVRPVDDDAIRMDDVVAAPVHLEHRAAPLKTKDQLLIMIDHFTKAIKPLQ